MKKIRTISGANIGDPSAIASISYSRQSGGQKNTEVGRHLLPLFDGTNYTTDASTAISLPDLGRNIAIFNTVGAHGTITLGESSAVLSLGVGVTDASGHVGIPCEGNSWTYIACFDKQWLIASAASLKVFLIEDDSYIRIETTR